MNCRNRFLRFTLCSAMALALTLSAAAQSSPVPPHQPTPAVAPTEKEIADTQVQLIQLLRFDPTLTSVVARDPSLLADQQYVARNNPELAQFLMSHPDVARNPEFYLFSRVSEGRGSRDQALERAVWPELSTQYMPSQTHQVMEDITPMIVLPLLFAAIVWMIRLFVENGRCEPYLQAAKRDSRAPDRQIQLQPGPGCVYGDSGGEAVPDGVTHCARVEVGQHMPNAVARVLTPLQAGIVMTLLGIGLLLLRHAGTDMETPMTVLGTLALMPGIGFILSAAATWVLAHRLGIMPEKPSEQTHRRPSAHKTGSEFERARPWRRIVWCTNP